MKKILLIISCAVLAGIAADASLVSVSKTDCKQKADAQNNITACNYTGMNIKIEGGGDVIFGGCNLVVNAPISIYQNQQCSSSAS